MFRASRAILTLAVLSACIESQVVLSGPPGDAATSIEAPAPDASDDGCADGACIDQPDVRSDSPADVVSEPPSGMCGGVAGLTCAADEWCDYDACGAADELGTCRKRPNTCNTVAPCLSQVCGCDGKTYCESCFAEKAGTDVRAPGPC